MMSSSLVSVVMPTYNRADFIEQAIDSVLEQSYKNIELFVIDDGSTDGTKVLLDKYESDPRFNYIYQPNQGQSVARNHGIKLSSGEYLSFVDSDNAWFLDKLEKLVTVAESHAGFDIFYGDGVSIDVNGDEITRLNMPRFSGKITKHLLQDNCVSFNTTLVRKKCFDEMGGFNEKDRFAEDYELWLRFSTRYQFMYIPELLAYYRVMEDQISSDKETRFASNKALVEMFLEKFPDAASQSEINEGWCRFYVRNGRYLAQSGELKQAFGAYLKALKYKPFGLPPWRAIARLIIKRS